MRTGARDKRRADQRAKFARAEKPIPMGYHEMRALWLARLRPVVAACAGRPMPACPLFTFTWFEPDRRRDPDNVRAGGTKLILDALVLGGVLAGDKAADVAGFRDGYVYGRTVGVLVEAGSDYDDENPWTMTVPFRLPDLNELIAAVRQDGILTERTRQARRGPR